MDPHRHIQLRPDHQAGGREYPPYRPDWQAKYETVLAAKARRGWKRTTMKPGDKVKVTVHAMKDGSNGASLMSLVVNGTPVGAAMELAPCFEIIGPRYTYESVAELYSYNFAGTRNFDGLADHNASATWVVGPYRRDWRDLDLAAMRMEMKVDGRVLADVRGGHPFVEPFLPVFCFANIVRHEDGLKAGQIIGTSSQTSFYQVEVGQRVTAQFEGLAPIEAVFVA